MNKLTPGPGPGVNLFTYTLAYLYFPRVTFSASESGLSTAMNGLEVQSGSVFNTPASGTPVNMEFSVLHRMGDSHNPNDTAGRRGQKLFYIWEFPTLHPAGINMFV